MLNDIKNNPYGRRHILSLWQDIEFDEELKGLHPCCFQTLWTVDGEYLDMTLIQRSGDLLGASIGINEIQYAGLLVMVAWECGLKPRKFTHFIQNLHIYDRHIRRTIIRTYASLQTERNRLQHIPGTHSY